MVFWGTKINMIKTGNISNINVNYKEWFLGKFIKESDFNTENIKNFEVKWSHKEKGYTFPLKENLVQDPYCKSMAILMRGKYKCSFLNDDGTFVDCLLENEGDYIFWAPDINHKIEALEDSVILTIRWYA